MPTATTNDLGPVVFEQQPSYVPSIVLIIVGALLLLLGGAISMGAGTLLFLASLGGFGVLCLIAGAVLIQRKRGYSAVLHQRGLREVRNGLERTLLYQNVEEISFRSTRVMLNGVYVGTVEELSLQSNDFGRAPLKFRNEYKEKAATRPVSIAPLSEQIAASVAARFDEQLRRGGQISCAGRVSLTAGGLDIPAKGRVGWEQVERHELNQGKFRLWLRGDTRPVLELSAGAANFLPFYRLLSERVRA